MGSSEKKPDLAGKKLLNCESSMTMEPMTSRDGERSNAGGIQEKIGQPSVRSALIWIPTLSKGLDLIGLFEPNHSMIVFLFKLLFKKSLLWI